VSSLTDYLFEKDVTRDNYQALGNVVIPDLAVGKGLHYLMSTTSSGVGN
jgi:hypothetical protein